MGVTEKENTSPAVLSKLNDNPNNWYLQNTILKINIKCDFNDNGSVNVLLLDNA